jgi:hypothetical protein
MDPPPPSLRRDKLRIDTNRIRKGLRRGARLACEAVVSRARSSGKPSVIQLYVPTRTAVFFLGGPACVPLSPHRAQTANRPAARLPLPTTASQARRAPRSPYSRQFAACRAVGLAEADPFAVEFLSAFICGCIVFC